LKRVQANSAEMSVLWLSVNRSSAGGCTPKTMPPNAPKWEQAKIDKVKAWIAAGAKND
jgi:hypothetical protein